MDGRRAGTLRHPGALRDGVPAGEGPARAPGDAGDVRGDGHARIGAAGGSDAAADLPRPGFDPGAALVRRRPGVRAVPGKMALMRLATDALIALAVFFTLAGAVGTW